MKDPEKTDRLFATRDAPPHFDFDEGVAAVFDDMIARSVPFYDETRATAIDLAGRFVQSNSGVYDLGCSTATLLIDLTRRIDDATVSLIGVDSAEAMLRRAREKIAASGLEDRISLIMADLEEPLAIERASVVFLHYTLQFIDPPKRVHLLRNIYDGLTTNGGLIVIEKIRGPNSTFDRLYVDLYHTYKQRQGYSDEEIRRKREALENVLIPYRLDENLALIERAGFNNVDVFFKWNNFAGIIAVKA